MTLPRLCDDTVDIIEFLPHRHPFRFVDRVKQVQAGKSITTEVTFPIDHPIIAGHFPGRPIVPGVLLIECLAQAATLMLVNESHASRDTKSGNRYLAKVEQAVFIGPAYPGELLVARATAERGLLRYSFVSGDIARDGELIMRGRIAVAR